MKPKYVYRCAAHTDPGIQKTTNEDNYLDNPRRYVAEDILQRLGYLYAVADGVSGQVGGEVASEIAIDTLRMYYVLPQVKIPPEDRLRNVFLEAHRRIAEYAQEHQEYHGMGTTLTCLVVKDGVGYYAHVGDSRLYLLRHDVPQMKQLTNDHSLVAKFVREGKLTPEEAAEEDSNVLEQALGCVAEIRVDIGETEALQPGDLLLLTSDGLTDLVSDAKIRETILGSPSLSDACQRLITKANQHGGKDNITVVLIAVEDAQELNT